MELFPALILIVSLFASIASSAKKEKEKQAAQARQAESLKRRTETLQKLQQQRVQTPAAPAPSISFADVPGTVAAPTVHTHLQPDCAVHDAAGSLNFASNEGKDPCHEEQLTHARTGRPENAEAGGLQLDWTGDGLVKAFVMSEILTRPQQRRAR